MAGYEIKNNGNIATTVDALSYFTDTLIPGSAYEFVVTAIDNEGNRSTPATVDSIGGEQGVPANDDPVLPLVSDSLSTDCRALDNIRSMSLQWIPPVINRMRPVS